MVTWGPRNSAATKSVKYPRSMTAFPSTIFLLPTPGFVIALRQFLMATSWGARSNGNKIGRDFFSGRRITAYNVLVINGCRMPALTALLPVPIVTLWFSRIESFQLQWLKFAPHRVASLPSTICPVAFAPLRDHDWS